VGKGDKRLNMVQVLIHMDVNGNKIPVGTILGMRQRDKGE
jgi:hypothetical protein